MSAGARVSSALVHDSIVTPFDVGLDVAPTVGVTIAGRPPHGLAPQLSIDFSTSDMVRHDADGTTTRLQHVGTLSFAIGVSHSLPAGLRGTLAAGGLKYLPSDDTGIFSGGSGGLAGLGVLDVAYRLPLGAHDAPRRWWLDARYDVHAFTTPALHDAGFASSQAVHRVALTLRYDFALTK